jgi:hypothetical protein
MGDHVLELTAEGWVVRELPMNQVCERTKRCLILRCEKQDVVAEPARADQAVPEPRHGRKDASQQMQHRVVDERRRHEREKHRDVSGNPQPGIGVQSGAWLTDGRLGLRNLDDEATAEIGSHGNTQAVALACLAA